MIFLYSMTTDDSDLANEHEKWLCENAPNGKACVFVYDYPKTIKVGFSVLLIVSRNVMSTI